VIQRRRRQALGADLWRHSGGRKGATVYPAANIGPPRCVQLSNRIIRPRTTPISCALRRVLSCHGSYSILMQPTKSWSRVETRVSIGCGGSMAQSGRGTITSRLWPVSWLTLSYRPTIAPASAAVRCYSRWAQLAHESKPPWYARIDRFIGALPTIGVPSW